MFVKGKEKRTLEENSLEAIKMEKDLESISSHQGYKESNPSSSEKSIKKNKEPTDMESMQTVIKKPTNDIIDLKKSKGVGNKPFKPFLKNEIDSSPQIPPTLGIILEYYAMENYRCTHHVNHLKWTCHEFINSFTTMPTPPEPPKKKNKNDKEDDEEDQQEEEEDEEGEEPPSHLNLIWDEEEIGDDDDDGIVEEACVRMTIMFIVRVLLS